MKPWQQTLLGIVIGLGLVAVILVITAPHYDKGMILLPTRQPDSVTIYISGKVQNPGVYQLAVGSRVLDAVQKAGGFAANANQESINLAAILEDEDRLYIPEVGESQIAGQQDGAQAKLNINSASLADLDKLPGIGTVKAQAIIDYREQNGQFLSIEGIMKVPGFGAELFEQIKDKITVNP